MTAAELVEIAMMHFDNAISLVAIQLSVLSGYAIIIHIVGSSLSSSKFTVLNIGYLLWFSLLWLSTIGMMKNGLMSIALANEITGRDTIVTPNSMVYYSVVVAFGVGASIWYGFTLRHEENQ